MKCQNARKRSRKGQESKRLTFPSVEEKHVAGEEKAVCKGQLSAEKSIIFEWFWFATSHVSTKTVYIDCILSETSMILRSRYTHDSQ